MDISIVIPNYNGKELLQKNLPKVVSVVESYHNGKIELIVVDDASTDDSVDFLKEFSKKKHAHISFTYLVNRKNKGFSPTVNRGVQAASGEVIILLNTDVAPEKDFYLPLVKHFTDEKVFAVGCMDKSIEQGKVVLRGRGVGHWERGFLVHSLGDLSKDTTLWVNGGSGAFRKSIWERLGGLNEVFAPFYWEDIDIGYRALKSGYGLIFEKESVVVHEHEKGAIKKTYSANKIKAIAYRNQFFFAWINMTDFDLQAAHIFWLPYHLIKALLRSDLAFYKGFFCAFLMVPNIIQLHFRMKKHFIKTDKETTEGLQK